ncbi:MAG: hypothetical protein IKP68_11040 [Clostridia bacterium]|nr:hypothetical protein [Clostridia bacterium]
MKRIVALMIAAVMLICTAAFVVSCGNEATPANSEKETTPVATDVTTTAPASSVGGDTPTEPVTSSEATTSGTPTTPTETTSGGTTVDDGDGYSKPAGYLDVDFGGRTFTFVTTSDWADGVDRFNTEREIAVESRTGGTVIDTAVYDRNAVMKKLYNCEIKAIEGSASGLIQNDVNSGTNEYDFGGQQYLWYTTNKSGYYVNLYDLDLNMDIEGWNRALFDQVTVRDKNGVDKLYTLDADFNLSTFRATWVIYCNLDLYNQNFSESLFDIVRNGEWTIDKMMEMITAVAQDDGDQTWTAGTDTFGLMTTQHNSIGLIMSMGIRTVTVDENHVFSTSAEQIVANNAVEAVTKGGELCNMDGVYIGGYSTNHESYAAGKTLFMGECMYLLPFDILQGVNTTVVPEPLYSSETQHEYRSYVNNKGTTYLISKNACGGDKQMMADFINVFVYHSHKIVYPAFLTAYGQIYCQDEQSVDMLKIITSGINYDFSYYKGNVMGLIQEMMHTGKNQLSRAANQYQKSLQSQIDTLVSNMTESK